MVTESGQPKSPPFDKEYLRNKFSIKGSESEKPLLYQIIFGLKPDDSPEAHSGEPVEDKYTEDFE